MKQQLLALIKSLAIIEVVILLGLGAVCFFGGWFTLHNYLIALMLVGAVTFTFGPISSSFSGQNIQAYDNTRFFHPAQRDQLIRRIQSGQPQESTSLPRFAQLLMIAGALNFGVALALQALVG
jgi:hypothetical protein